MAENDFYLLLKQCIAECKYDPAFQKWFNNHGLKHFECMKKQNISQNAINGFVFKLNEARSSKSLSNTIIYILTKF